MTYDFDRIINRRGTHSLKWNVPEEELPMWVADMDFEAAPEITSALKQRAAFGVFGYTVIPDEWMEAISGWWNKRHHFQMEREWLVFCTGIVPALSSAIRKLTTVGEYVLIQPPVYNMFYNCIQDNGRRVAENRLLYDGRQYRIDWQDLEKKLEDPQTNMMLLCNPQNPAGSIWTKEELARIGDLCAAHHVTVVSDEIHCDLTDPGYEYIPFASVSQVSAANSITCIAPTKTFNLAGLQTAAVMVPDVQLRHKIQRAFSADGVAEPNVFAIEGAVSAFNCGENWLDSLRLYLAGNRKAAEDFLCRELPQVTLVPSHATYLLWLDCGRVVGDTSQLCRHLRSEVGLYVSPGAAYGENGSEFLRLNMACPRAQLMEGLKRLKKGVVAYEKYMVENC